MPLDNNFFTPEEIDKQIEDLSNTFDVRNSDIHTKQNMRLIQHIRRFYRTNPEEDTHTLNNAWERVAHERMHAKLYINENGQVNEMRFAPTTGGSIAKKTIAWRRSGILAAVVLMGILVGSMLLVFNEIRQSRSENGANVLPKLPVTHRSAQDPQLNLYVSDFGFIYKIDSKTGKKDWTFNPHSSSTQRPLVMDGVVYFSSGDAEPYVYALNASNGTVRWKAQSQSLSAVAHEIVYTTHTDVDNIHIDLDALDARTGKVLWHYNPGLQAAMATIRNGVLYGTGSIDMSNNSALYALDATTGAQLWNVHVQDQFFNMPQIVNNVLYATSTRDNKDVSPPVRSGYAYAFAAKTGKQLWRTVKINAYISAGPTIADGVMYIVTNNVNAGTSFIYAMRPNDGTVMWKKFIAGDINGAPLFLNGDLYAGASIDSSTTSSTNGVFILALKAIDGSTLWSHPITNIFPMFVGASLAIGPRGLYAGTGNGKVLVLDLRKGSQLHVYQVTSDRHIIPAFPPLVTLAP